MYFRVGKGESHGRPRNLAHGQTMKSFDHTARLQQKDMRRGIKEMNMGIGPTLYGTALHQGIGHPDQVGKVRFRKNVVGAKIAPLPYVVVGSQ